MTREAKLIEALREIADRSLRLSALSCWRIAEKALASYDSASAKEETGAEPVAVEFCALCKAPKALPCDVHLPPNTIIRKGVQTSTFVLALTLPAREGEQFISPASAPAWDEDAERKEATEWYWRLHASCELNDFIEGWLSARQPRRKSS